MILKIQQKKHREKSFEKHVTLLSIRLHEIYTTDNINSDFNKQK